MKIKKWNPFSLLGSKHALRPTNHIFFLVVAVMALGFFDVERLGGNFGSWFVVFLIGFLVTVAAIELGKRLSLDISNSNLAAIQASLILLTAGLIRGLTVFFTGQALELIPQNDFIFRLVGGPIFVFSVYLASNSILASFAGFREESNKLLAEKERLEFSQSNYSSDLELVTQQQRNQVSDLLLPAMWELQKKLSTATDPAKLQDALLTMQSLNNEVVRPLSKALSEDVAAPNLQEVVQNLPSTNQPKLEDKVRLAEVQPPWLYFGILLLIGLNSQIAFTSVSQGLTIVGIALVPIAALYLIERASFGKTPIAVGPALFLSAFLGGLAGFMAGILVSYTGLAFSSIFIWQSTLLVATLKATNTIFGMYLGGWERSVDQLREVTQLQRIVNSRLKQQVWLGRKALAMELHGSVQATLQALAIRLSRMQDPDPKELAEIMSAVRQSLERIENQDYLAGQDLKALLLELKELWEGTCQVTWKISKSATAYLKGDPGLARCTFEVIRESVTNAVKHGSATKISIEIDLREQALMLRVVNNGDLVVEQKESFGTELMDQLCLSRQLNVEGKKTTLTAELALNPKFWTTPQLV